MSAQIKNPRTPVAADQLREIEKRLGLELPVHYRSFLLTSNGGEPMPGWFRYGVEDGVSGSLAERANS